MRWLARHRHAGNVDLIVTREDWQGRGVAATLLAEVIDLADRWLNLERLGLIVFVDNVHARRLYERYGFEVEGVLRRFAFGDGAYLDAYAMSRLRPRPVDAH